MFRHILIRVGRGKRIREFEERLAHERGRGYVLDAAEDQSWYVTLGKTAGEFANERVSRVRLYSQQHDVSGGVCIANLTYDPDGQVVFLGDLKSYVENKGYGSTMLRNIIKLAKQVGACEIRGNLSEVDSDHFDKLEHIYRKFGFNVQFNKLRTSGTIYLVLM